MLGVGGSAPLGYVGQPGPVPGPGLPLPVVTNKPGQVLTKTSFDGSEACDPSQIDHDEQCNSKASGHDKTKVRRHGCQGSHGLLDEGKVSVDHFHVEGTVVRVH